MADSSAQNMSRQLSPRMWGRQVSLNVGPELQFRPDRVGSSVANDDRVAIGIGRGDANVLVGGVEVLPRAAVDCDGLHALLFGMAKTDEQSGRSARGRHLDIRADLAGTSATLDRCRSGAEVRRHALELDLLAVLQPGARR